MKEGDGEFWTIYQAINVSRRYGRTRLLVSIAIVIRFFFFFFANRIRGIEKLSNMDQSFHDE